MTNFNENNSTDVVMHEKGLHEIASKYKYNDSIFTVGTSNAKLYNVDAQGMFNYGPQRPIGTCVCNALSRNVNIMDVEILIPNKVVRVTFNDGTFEKAVCHEEDIFSLDTAIGICIAKHYCGGSSKYNNLINKGIKFYNSKLKAEEDARIEQKRIEAKRKKYQEKKAKRLERKAKEDRDARIKEHAEAIVLAHEMMNTISIDKEFQFEQE